MGTAMTDKLDKLTPPAKPLVWPSNAREVTGVPMAFIGAEHLRPRPLKAEAPAPSPAPAPAPPERK
jgi:hypothetical protein